MKRMLLSLLLLGCEDPEVGPSRVSVGCYYDHTRAEEAARFIVECARAANPMSDEEGEDLVAECRKTGMELFCVPAYRVHIEYDLYQRCDMAHGRHRDACVKAGWVPVGPRKAGE